MSYQYRDPLKQGYKKFKLTTKQHNELFKYRKKKWYSKYEYYYNENQILLHGFTNKFAIVINTILFPLIVLVNGIGNIKEIIDDFKRLYNEKKYGSFTSDHVWSVTEKYNQIMEIINKQK